MYFQHGRLTLVKLCIGPQKGQPRTTPGMNLIYTVPRPHLLGRALIWPSAFLDHILRVCRSLRDSFLYLGKLHWFLYLMLSYFFYDPSMFIFRWSSNFVEKSCVGKGAWRPRWYLVFPTLCNVIVQRVNLNKLSRNVVGALRTTTTNCRVSFIDLYLVFPTNFRIVFLRYTNAVILLEPYCGTITEPGLPVPAPKNTKQIRKSQPCRRFPYCNSRSFRQMPTYIDLLHLFAYSSKLVHVMRYNSLGSLGMLYLGNQKCQYHFTKLLSDPIWNTQCRFGPQPQDTETGVL